VKPPISYYGGKQRLAHKIIPLIPPHTVYVEPFAGGAAVLFNKHWPDVTNTHHYREVINDIDGDLINFYRQLRDNGDAICRLIELTPYSRDEHRTAKDLENCDDLERARRYFVNTQQSFVNTLCSGWAITTFGPNHTATWARKIKNLPEYLDRIAWIYIEQIDAIECIKKWDSPQTFFYCDPPYPGTEQGHYSGFNLNDFQKLVDTLATIQGSFILSCYSCGEKVPDSWERFEFSATMTAARDKSVDKKRTEIVYRKITNETMRPELQKLFDNGKFDCFKGANYMAEITIKVPIDDPRALKAAAKMLMDLAGAPIKVVEAVEAPPVEALGE